MEKVRIIINLRDDKFIPEELDMGKAAIIYITRDSFRIYQLDVIREFLSSPQSSCEFIIIAKTPKFSGHFAFASPLIRTLITEICKDSRNCTRLFCYEKTDGEIKYYDLEPLTKTISGDLYSIGYQGINRTGESYHRTSLKKTITESNMLTFEDTEPLEIKSIRITVTDSLFN